MRRTTASPDARRRSTYAADRFVEVAVEERRRDLAWLRKRLAGVEVHLVARTPFARERREVRRRAAEQYFDACLTRSARWTTTREALAKLEALGYTNVDRRVHCAIMLGRYAPATRGPAEIVLRRLRAAIRATKALPRRSPFRRTYVPTMEHLVRARWRSLAGPA